MLQMRKQVQRGEIALFWVIQEAEGPGFEPNQSLSSDHGLVVNLCCVSVPCSAFGEPPLPDSWTGLGGADPIYLAFSPEIGP